jgi:hypothetical protein
MSTDFASHKHTGSTPYVSTPKYAV